MRLAGALLTRVLAVVLEVVFVVLADMGLLGGLSDDGLVVGLAEGLDVVVVPLGILDIVPVLGAVVDSWDLGVGVTRLAVEETGLGLLLRVEVELTLGIEVEVVVFGFAELVVVVAVLDFRVDVALVFGAADDVLDDSEVRPLVAVVLVVVSLLLTAEVVGFADSTFRRGF